MTAGREPLPARASERTPELDAEWLALERERLREEVRLREADLQLRREQLESSRVLPEPRTWRSELRTAFFGTLPLLTALAAPAVGLMQFGWSQTTAAQTAADARTREAELQAQTARLEARKAFDAKKLKLYEQAIAVSGSLAGEPMGTPGFQKAQKDFERLYWAELPLVETPEVESAMVRLRGAVSSKDPAEINQGVIDLAKIVRAELAAIYTPPSR